MLEEIVLPQGWHIQLDQCHFEEGLLVLSAHIATINAACPICTFVSAKIHSRYTRRLADLPLTGHAVQIYLLVRRFFCLNTGCERRTFVEQLPLVMAQKARRTKRQYQLLLEQAFALGGEPGSRQVTKMGMKVCGDTLLRLIRKTPLPDWPTPRILGVDDWSFRKGVEYGTILIDLEEHRPVDLLADRKADTFARWLEEHPGVEIISRDRASSYADGARRGAPEAIQVADRFHLLKNLGDHLKSMFERKNACLLTPQPDTPDQERLLQQEFKPLNENEAAENTVVKVASQLNSKAQEYSGDDPRLLEAEEIKEKPVEEVPIPSLAFTSRKHYLFEHIKALNTEGLSQRTIALELRISRHTVKKYLRAQQAPRYTPRPHRASKLDSYKTYIANRWKEGVCKVMELFLEIKERGYSGSWALLAQYLAKYRLEHPAKQSDKLGRGRPAGSGKAARQTEGTKSKLKPQPMLSAREAAWVMLKMPDDLSEKQQNLLKHLRNFDQELEAAYQFTQEFKTMSKEREGYKLEKWLQEVEGKAVQAQLMELGSFANGIRQDQAAVKAGLSLEYSQGQTEGQVNRLKTLKRTMYGRAKLTLLRARVLHRETA